MMPNEQTKCIQKNAVLELQMKILIAKHAPLAKENAQLRSSLQHVEQKAFRYEMMSYGIGIAAAIAIFVMFRKALRFRYRKELSFGINEDGVNFNEQQSTEGVVESTESS